MPTLKKILFIHGRSFKPKKADWQALWHDAITFGLERDFGPSILKTFQAADPEYVYYGDLNNAFLEKHKNSTRPDDIKDRRESLEELKTYGAHQFRKAQYRRLPGVNPWYDHLADTFGAFANAIHLGQPVIQGYAPDMAHYWSEAEFGGGVRWRLTEPLRQALADNREVMIVAHSLGSIIAYDALWKFSRYGEYRNHPDTATQVNRPGGGKPKPISALVTLGSPLSDETVKRNLKGAKNKDAWKYPDNLKYWYNVAAEDDFICHDTNLRNDFEGMIKLGLIERKRFVQPLSKVYNLAVRSGENGQRASNPHNGVGYLLHPVTVEYIGKWLRGSPVTMG
ncbi:MAG: hypothetical protein AAGK14_06525 [Verrucomicrobiota bacterium]